MRPALCLAFAFAFACAGSGCPGCGLRVDRGRILTGEGEGEGDVASGIVVTPAACEFGDVDVGSVAICTVTIANGAAAARDLVVDSFSVEGNSLVTLSTTSTPHTLAPETSFTVDVRFGPSTGGEVNGTLTISSSDAVAGDVVVPLHGTGVDGPVCAARMQSVNGVDVTPGAAPNIRPLDDLVLTLAGSATTDAAGSIASYAWSIASAPSGSTAVLGAPGASDTHFAPDVAGAYSVCGAVVDDAGAPSTNDCCVAFTAFASADLVVEVSLDSAVDDVVLELVTLNETNGNVVFADRFTAPHTLVVDALPHGTYKVRLSRSGGTGTVNATTTVISLGVEKQQLIRSLTGDDGVELLRFGWAGDVAATCFEDLTDGNPADDCGAFP